MTMICMNWMIRTDDLYFQHVESFGNLCENFNVEICNDFGYHHHKL